MKSPYTTPLNVARGLENLADFIDSAGFASAARLVKMAALAAWDDIARVAAAPDQRKRRKARARPPPHGNVIRMRQHRPSFHCHQDDTGDDDGDAG